MLFTLFLPPLYSITGYDKAILNVQEWKPALSISLGRISVILSSFYLERMTKRSSAYLQWGGAQTSLSRIKAVKMEEIKHFQLLDGEAVRFSCSFTVFEEFKSGLYCCRSLIVSSTKVEGFCQIRTVETCVANPETFRYSRDEICFSWSSNEYVKG